MPRQSRPAQSGLWGCPTLINNVETFANVPPIIIMELIGLDSGVLRTAQAPDLCHYWSSGQHRYLIRVPGPRTLREVIFDIGGGVRNNQEV